MELVVKQLSEIEAAAAKIMENTTEQKKEIARLMEEKTKAFDKQVDGETSKTLEALSDDLQKQAELELKELRQNTEEAMKMMDKTFEKYHTQIAKRVLDTLTRA